MCRVAVIKVAMIHYNIGKTGTNILRRAYKLFFRNKFSVFKYDFPSTTKLAPHPNDYLEITYAYWYLQ